MRSLTRAQDTTRRESRPWLRPESYLAAVRLAPSWCKPRYAHTPPALSGITLVVSCLGDCMSLAICSGQPSPGGNYCRPLGYRSWQCKLPALRSGVPIHPIRRNPANCRASPCPYISANPPSLY
ncbi:hypothetical protein GQ53DRAFT_754944 [Thozetella sp. PMI_491]|nr:hypothetical protein GQ53DRAFT_754944 [Thozetella sp. PMI_491]